MNPTAYDQIRKKIETALDELRPYLAQDGGGISLMEITNDLVVKLEYLGACKSCSMSMSTFKAGIEHAVLKAVPEVKAVEVINMPSLEKF